MPTFTAPLNVLQRGLHAVTPHLDFDTWTPALECVNVVNDGTDILLLSTDRFSAAEYRIPHVEIIAPDVLRGGEVFLLTEEAVEHVREFTNVPRSDWDDAPPQYAPDGWTVIVDLVDADPDDLSTGALLISIIDDAGVTRSMRRLESRRTSYPAVHGLFPDRLTPASTIGASADILGRVAKTANFVGDVFGPTEITISTGHVESRRPVFVIEYGDAPVRVLFSQRELTASAGGE
ncbi:hypothetical protein J2X60_002977 [Curtobacterium sp. 320]|uniref:hypothetical protein n=1 Tax=Curtobacterium sp. 320 TaxID=2817749 RepID=UPI0028609CAB|nr:hypothetical protein [Curtobacterium sp. 320]MDR6574318.1 hypothetical protein [Curtobacterium sp. 320]